VSWQFHLPLPSSRINKLSLETFAAAFAAGIAARLPKFNT